MSMTRHAVADWDGNPAPEAPVCPDTMKEAGLSQGFICDMLLRTIYTRGAMLGRDLAQYLCLPFKVIREPLKFLKDEKCLQVDGGDLDVGSDWTEARASLRALPGVTRLHIDQVAHWGLGDPDAFPIDQRVASGARTAGLPWQAPRLRRHAEAWRPWRAYAAQHLSSLGAHVT